MSLEICDKCFQPFLSEHESCPRCNSKEYTWDQESWANMGCFLALFLLAFIFVIAPLILILTLFVSAVIR